MDILKIGAFVCLFPDPVQADFDHLPADAVPTSSVIVCRIFLARDEILWAIQIALPSNPHFVDSC
jgi:hypothetical protein